MKTTTLLEVMAEVGRTAGDIGSLRDAPNVGSEARAVLARCNISTAIENTDPSVRRDRLLRAAAWAILALHAHDAEDSAESKALPDRMPPVCSACRGDYSSAFCEPCRNTGVTQCTDCPGSRNTI